MQVHVISTMMSGKPFLACMMRISDTLTIRSTGCSPGYANMTTGERVDESDFYAPDVGDGGYYNTIRVEVVVWRI